MHRVPVDRRERRPARPRSSRRSARREDEILDKLGFATLPTQETDLVPLGGMGMHVSAYALPRRSRRRR